MRYIQQIIMIVATVTTPILISLYTEEREDLIKIYINRFIPQGIFLWSIIIVISIMSLPLFIPLFFGNAFISSTLPAQILLTGLTFNAISCFYSGIMVTYKLVKQMAVISIFMALLNLAGDLLLVPIIGINGAAISSALAFSIGGIGYMYIGNKRLHLSEVKSLIFIVPVGIIFMGIIYEINLFLIVAIATVICYFILAQFKLFQCADTKLLDHINMPSKVRKIIYKTYKILEI